MPRPGKAAEVTRWLEQHRPARIGEVEFAELRAALTPVSESYLRKLVRECGVPLHPMVAGVRQATLDELEQSLRQLLEEYEQGDGSRRQAVRRLVITAKDHARLAGRNPARRADKDEVVLWLTIWLQNPPLFPAWVAVRRDTLGRSLLRH